MQPLVSLTHGSDTDRWKASYRDNIKMENQAKKRKRITFTMFYQLDKRMFVCFTSSSKNYFSLKSAKKIRSHEAWKFLTSLMTHG